MNKFIETHKDEIEKFEYELISNEDKLQKKALAYIAYYLLGDGSEDDSTLIDEDNITCNGVADFVWFDANEEEETIAIVKLSDAKTIIESNKKLISNIKDYKKNNKEFKEVIKNVTKNFEKINSIPTKYYLIAMDKTISNKDGVKQSIHDSFDIEDTDSFEILDIEDLNKIITQGAKKELYVKQETLKLDTPGNVLRFSSNYNIVNDAMVCNISAKSLKEIHKKHGPTVFNLNLRFFKNKKDVDDDIKKSINDGDKFWFLNNGLYIVCDKCDINGDKLTLHNFSIVNGGQTTHKISNTDFSNDFYLMCKVISINDWFKEDKQDESFKFANEIAVASNKQKPIQNQDLISNLPEVKKLDVAFNNYKNDKFGPIFCETKKGEYSLMSANKKKCYIKEHVKSAEFFMQLRYIWDLIQPGTAKAKSKIYKNIDNVKDSLNEVTDNINTYPQVLWLHNSIKQFATNMKKKEKQGQISKELSNISKYCDFYNLATLRVLYQFYKTGFKSEFSDEISDCKSFDDVRNVLNKPSFKCELILNNTDRASFTSTLYDLLASISKDVLTKTLKDKYPNSGDLGQTHNLVKSDDGFLFYIQHIIDCIKFNTDAKQLVIKLFE